MNWDRWIRQIHRWLSVIFMTTVVITFIALQGENPPQWVNYIPLPPLFLLMFTGIYLFALPYVAKWRNRPASD